MTGQEAAMTEQIQTEVGPVVFQPEGGKPVSSAEGDTHHAQRWYQRDGDRDPAH